MVLKALRAKGEEHLCPNGKTQAKKPTIPKVTPKVTLRITPLTS
jgi:hypothetical protein